ncbi:LacI family DNA-binding transcriptional regulator [Paenibacillus eucommiae]|uniref:LacI family transcriptional regulator n=1 Tax=Paenibacillus eucommiae TaxID=1355755 RepID=A0ABS4J737_9BACL|nr:LacI family DNA-binding transcriptional regulator [Paenibacillus eucommiae]MBP1995628.1 LacI family transcriptional regulator [Paenibacillus eucommiae]
MSSIKEIAKLAEVSQGTASIVLNGKGDQQRISQATQQRIYDAARKLDYRPNISARRLRSGGETVAPIIALFWTLDTRASLIGRFLKGVHDELKLSEEEHELLIQPYVSTRLCDVKSLITGTRFNAAIIANATEEDEKFLNEANINVPIVLHLRSSDKYSSVSVDNYQTGQEVARLFASRGHKRAGLIVPELSSRAIRNRMEGFLDGAKAYGLEISAEHITGGDFTEEGGYNAADQLLLAEERPSSLFVLSDQMAIGVLAKLHERNIRVPEEIEIVGHDDSESSRFAYPSLTTVHLPVEEMAATCVQLSIDLMNHQIVPPVAKIFTPHIVVRNSCGDFINN